MNQLIFIICLLSATHYALSMNQQLIEAPDTEKIANQKPDQTSIIADLQTTVAPLLKPPLWKIILEYRGSEHASYHHASIPITWDPRHTFSIDNLKIIQLPIRYWDIATARSWMRTESCLTYSLATLCYKKMPGCICNNWHLGAICCLQNSYKDQAIKHSARAYRASAKPLTAQSADGRFTVTTVEEKSPFHTLYIIDHHNFSPAIDPALHTAFIGGPHQDTQ